MSSLPDSESAIFPTESPVAASIAPQDMVGEGKAWGLCTAVDLQDCHPDLIRNADHIRRYVVELCELIDMKRFGECQVVDFGSGRVDQRPFCKRYEQCLPRHFQLQGL
jgi:hypothetical protein